MPIVFRCEHCLSHCSVEESQAESQIRCPSCGREITVPELEADEPSDREIVGTSPGGSTIYHHQSRTIPFDPATGDPEMIDAISDHIEEHIGEIDSVFHELVSDLVHIDLHLVRANEERPWHTLVTSGMSDAPMTVPEGAEEYRYGELMISLPPDWPLEQDVFDQEQIYWPLRLTKQLARMPHEYDTWIGPGHTITNGDPPLPYADNTDFSCALLLPPILVEEAFLELEISEEKQIHFYAVVPLYPEEMDYKLQYGTDALLDRFDQYGISEILDIDRPNTCQQS